MFSGNCSFQLYRCKYLGCWMNSFPTWWWPCCVGPFVSVSAHLLTGIFSPFSPLVGLWSLVSVPDCGRCHCWPIGRVCGSQRRVSAWTGPEKQTKPLSSTLYARPPAISIHFCLSSPGNWVIIEFPIDLGLFLRGSLHCFSSDSSALGDQLCDKSTVKSITKLQRRGIILREFFFWKRTHAASKKLNALLMGLSSSESMHVV